MPTESEMRESGLDKPKRNSGVRKDSSSSIPDAALAAINRIEDGASLGFLSAPPLIPQLPSERGADDPSVKMADGMGRWSLSNAFTRKGKSSNNLARDLAAQVAQVKKESAKGAAGHLRARDIVHVNTGAWRLKLLQEILHGPPAIVLMVFLIMYVLTAMIFAGIYMSFGKECYKLEDESEFTFAACLWISIHIFSTVGFGNVAPRQTCVKAQVGLTVEFFVSLLIVSAISGYVVKSFLTPLTSVRFSKVILLNKGRRRVMSTEEEQEKRRARRSLEAHRGQAEVEPRYLTFRMVRKGNAQLRDVHVHLMAQWWHPSDGDFGDSDSHKGHVGTLNLEHDHFTTLEQLQVWHKLDQSSPLFPILQNIDVYLDGIEVSVNAFDMASLQPVRMFWRYSRKDLRLNACYVNTLSTSNNPRHPEQLLADHSKIDLYEPEEIPDGGDTSRSGSLSTRKKRISDSGIGGIVQQATAFAGTLATATSDTIETVKRAARAKRTCSTASEVSVASMQSSKSEGRRPSLKAFGGFRRPSKQNVPTPGDPMVV